MSRTACDNMVAKLTELTVILMSVSIGIVMKTSLCPSVPVWAQPTVFQQFPLLAKAHITTGKQCQSFAHDLIYE